MGHDNHSLTSPTFIYCTKQIGKDWLYSCAVRDKVLTHHLPAILSTFPLTMLSLRALHRTTITQCLSYLLLALVMSSSIAWTFPSPILSQSSRALFLPNHVLFSSSKDTTSAQINDNDDNNINNNDDEAYISDIDARVLQSMLQDEKLNLQEEQNMKRLLERGIKSKDPVAQEAKKRAKEETVTNVETEYSSQFLKTLGDTKLWKGLSRNAADWFESAKIWVENKVERDTKLVASLGFFAFERALQDVKRALPASVAKQVTTTFLLDTTTLANQNQNQTSMDIRNQMTTPQDEIKAVTQEIRWIIQSGGDRTLRSTGGGLLPSNARGLQSAVTSKQGKDRFLKAYQRRKQTTLRREQETLAQTSARLAGSVIDSAYQVKRELQVEPNQPGYKTKALREGAAQTSRLLASGAKGFLSGAKAAAQAALTDGTNRGNAQLPSISSSSSTGGMAATDAALDAALAKLGQKKSITSFIDATIVDATVINAQRPSTSMPPKRPRTSADAPINARIPGTSSYGPPTTTDVTALYGAPPKAPTGKVLDNKDAWVFNDKSKEEEEEDLLFFASREALDFQKEQTVSSLLSDIKKSESTASNSRLSYFTQATPEGNPMITPEVVEAVLDAQAATGRSVPPDSIEVNRDYANDMLIDNEEEEDFGYDYLLDDEDPQDTLRRVMAEIVSDEDFEYAVGQAKRVDNTAGQEIEDNDKTESSLLVLVVLRILDVIFLILEKVILVSTFILCRRINNVLKYYTSYIPSLRYILQAIPSLLSALPRVASRVAAVQNDGTGVEGWQTISNVQRGDKRY